MEKLRSLVARDVFHCEVSNPWKQIPAWSRSCRALTYFSWGALRPWRPTQSRCVTDEAALAFLTYKGNTGVHTHM